MIVGKYMNYESLPGQTFMNDVVDNFFSPKKRKLLQSCYWGQFICSHYYEFSPEIFLNFIILLITYLLILIID